MTAQELFSYIEEVAITCIDLGRHGVLPHGSSDERTNKITIAVLARLLNEIEREHPGEFERIYRRF